MPNTGRINIQFKVQYLSAAIDPEADLLVHKFLELWGVRLRHSLLFDEICKKSDSLPTNFCPTSNCMKLTKTPLQLQQKSLLKLSCVDPKRLGTG
jgi:hypothetical protein